MEPAELIRKECALMGSPFTIRAYASPHIPLRLIHQWIELAFGEIARIEDLLTDFRPSPLNEINRMAGIRPVKVCREIFDLLELCLQISRDSDGAFDISYASVGLVWREAMKTGVPPAREEIDRAKQFVDFRKIGMNPETREVFLPHQEMKIGLGGIGKGYAVDRAFHLLKGLGVENFAVNGAGDIRVHSSPLAPRPWRIGIRNPFAERDAAMGGLLLQNGAVATSGDYERFFRHRGKSYHHVLDGRTGEITRGISSVTIMAASTVTADVCATTAMALGPDEGLKFLENKRGLSGFLVTADGSVIRTENLPKAEAGQWS
ncbi:MAG: FAD:protein FMN transferase [Deltaproteobacteria bacterium]|nr:FAD:protein FMN transferase [Deltaproteobacteria bacterium]